MKSSRYSLGSHRALLRFASVFAACCFSLLAAHPANGITVKYPKDTPLFSMEVPDGWKVEEDDSRLERVLTITPKNGKLGSQIYLLGMAGSGSLDLESAVQRLAEATVGDNPKITEVRYSDPVENKSATGIPLARESALCKIDGVPTYFLFTVFVPDTGRRFEAVLCSPVPLKETGANTLDSILHSIKPIE